MRLPEESDEAFRERVTRTGQIARMLVEACFRNRQVQELLAEGVLTEKGLTACPIVRVDFEQASYAIGHPGETLHATRNKHWGDGPYILPLEPDEQGAWSD